MTTISRHPASGGSAAGKLAATLLSVTVAGMADPGRFRRGKEYVLDDAVLRVDVQPGVLRAEVLGSRPDPYVATISVDQVVRPGDLPGAQLERHHASLLCPDPEAIVASCTCPDDDDPCKHAVAALLVFAQELAARPQLLVEWRCGTAPALRREAGSRAATGRHLRLVGGQRPDPAERLAANGWAAFEHQAAAIPDVAGLFAALKSIPPAGAHAAGVDVGALVRSAQQRMRITPE